MKDGEPWAEAKKLLRAALKLSLRRGDSVTAERIRETLNYMRLRRVNAYELEGK